MSPPQRTGSPNVGVVIPTRNAARAEVPGRIDADSVPGPDWLEQVQQAFTDPELGAATGPVLYYDLSLPRLGLAIDASGRHRMMRWVAGRHPFLYGAIMAIHRLFEDIGLSVHLNEHTGRIAYLPLRVLRLLRSPGFAPARPPRNMHSAGHQGGSCSRGPHPAGAGYVDDTPGILFSRKASTKSARSRRTWAE